MARFKILQFVTRISFLGLSVSFILWLIGGIFPAASFMILWCAMVSILVAGKLRTASKIQNRRQERPQRSGARRDIYGRELGT